MTYYTDYSIEDCIGLLSRKNIYDVFEYSFEMKTDNTGEIRFIRGNKRLWSSIWDAVYMIKFLIGTKTIIAVEFISEGPIFALSSLPPQYITEFMKQKLDAVEVLEEDDTSM